MKHRMKLQLILLKTVLWADEAGTSCATTCDSDLIMSWQPLIDDVAIRVMEYSNLRDMLVQLTQACRFWVRC
jgi:hypothetical protein